MPTCEHGSPHRGQVIVVLLFGGSFEFPPLPDFVVDVDFSVSSVGGLSLPLPLAPLPPVGGGVGGELDGSFVDLLRIGLKCTDLCG